MTKVALFQATSGIDPTANGDALASAVEAAGAGGAKMLFTPEMSGLLDRDRARISPPPSITNPRLASLSPSAPSSLTARTASDPR